MKKILALIALASLFAGRLVAGEIANPSLTEIEKTGHRSGLVLVLGQPNITLAEQLARSGRYLAHQLVPADLVEELRRTVLDQGVSGRVVVTPLSNSKKLPHPDRMCDLVIADLKQVPIPEAELHRVLNIGGKLLLKQGESWKTIDRAEEKDIDFWTHKWHGPSGQVLSQDRKAGPPTAIQWAAGPALADGAVSGKHPVLGGGAFATVDNVDGALQIRSAGNGLPRWRSDFGLSPLAELLIDGDRIVCRPAGPLGNIKGRSENGPLTAFELRTGTSVVAFTDAPQNKVEPGRSKAAFPSTLALGDKLLAVAGPNMAVLERANGKRIWSKQLEKTVWFSPIVLDGTVIACESEVGTPPTRARIDNAPTALAVLGLDLVDGKQKWRIELDRKAPPLLPMIAAEGKVFLHTGSYQSRTEGAYIAALDVQTGKQIWRVEVPDGTKQRWSATDSASRIICRDGILYFVGGHSLGHVVAWEAATGKVIHQPQLRPKFVAYGGECSGSLATPNWLIMSGVTWWDKDFKAVNSPAARSACGTGNFPAQGMVFANPAGCDCTQYIRGYVGLGCTSIEKVDMTDEQRRTRGTGKPADQPQSKDDWPTFLADAQRTSSAKSGLPAKLRELWRVKAAPDTIPGLLQEDRHRDEYWNGPLTAPVAIDKTIIVGLSDAQAVAALEASTGKVRWRTALGGPMDTPPTIFRGVCILGTQDGWVHALSLTDGKPVWQFFAAPSYRPALLHGRIASAFPVPGSVCVLNDTVFVTSGCHSYLGGIYVWCLDPLTGQVRNKSIITGGETPTQETMVFNDVFSASLDMKEAWIFRYFRVGLDGQQIAVSKRLAGSLFPGAVATAVTMDRRAGVVRFPHLARGGSTHGWKAKMTSGPANAYRLVRDGAMAYGLEDPSDNYGRSTILFAQQADAKFHSEITPPIWSKTGGDLGLKESYTAMIKAGDSLYLGGGKRDGSSGFVQVVSAKDASLIDTLELPAQVSPCGLAAAHGQLIVSCLDGSVVVYGK